MNIKHSHPKWDPMLVRTAAYSLWSEYNDKIRRSEERIFTATNQFGLRTPANMDEVDLYYEEVKRHKEWLVQKLTELGMSLQAFHNLVMRFRP